MQENGGTEEDTRTFYALLPLLKNTGQTNSMHLSIISLNRKPGDRSAAVMKLLLHCSIMQGKKLTDLTAMLDSHRFKTLPATDQNKVILQTSEIFSELLYN